MSDVLSAGRGVMPRRTRGKRIVAIDFFCGAGGVTRGLSEAGIEVIAGIDVDSRFKETYETNNSTSRYIQKDISKVKKEELQDLIPSRPNCHLLFAGCAPCQPFSSHIRTIPDRNDNRRSALSHFGRIISDMKPDFVFSENVPGIASKYRGKIFTDFKNSLKKNRYNVVADVLDAKSFGVPQTRKRMMILASRIGDIELPRSTHGPGLIPYRTVRDAIGGYPRIKAGENYPDLNNHRAAGLSAISMTRMRATPKDGGSRKSWPRELWLRCHSRDDCGHSDVYGRMKFDSPAPTLTCRCYSISNGRFGHPVQDRAVSFREAAALQTFPDNYVFYGNYNSSLGIQIGNAVPILMARAVGEAFCRIVRGDPS